jgi:diacylglycerol kinase
MTEEEFLEKKSSKFSWKARLKSFVFAWQGIIDFFRTEHNAQIHLAVTILVIVLSIFFRVNKTETIAIIFSIALVWITEMVNTTIEKTMDFISLQRHPQIKIIKDLSAGAVLIAAIAAVIVGCIIFVPKIISL